jgi:hypothetical protein
MTLFLLLLLACEPDKGDLRVCATGTDGWWLDIAPEGTRLDGDWMEIAAGVDGCTWLDELDDTGQAMAFRVGVLQGGGELRTLCDPGTNRIKIDGANVACEAVE